MGGRALGKRREDAALATRAKQREGTQVTAMLIAAMLAAAESDGETK